jgi:copper-binding protein NosD
MRATIVLAVLLCAPLAHGRTIAVPPGPGTPVQDAIDAANPGDTIRLSVGLYPEHLVITKSIKIRGVASAAVDPNATTGIGACGFTGAPTIGIYADRVQLRSLAVGSDHTGGVQIDGDHVKLVDVFVGTGGCEVFSAPLVDVEFSNYVTLSKVWATAPPVENLPAGIRIANVQQQAHIRVFKSVAGHNDIGILLENAGPQAVRVYSSDVNFNDRGIVLRGTTGASVHHNKLVDNVAVGIGLDAASSQNAIVSNRVSGSATDVVDDGTSNCWRNNTFTTGSVPSCP